jgi:hypothetical protein
MIITNGKATTHGLAHHEDLLVDFPYLGRPIPPSRHAPHQPTISRSKHDVDQIDRG